jgi:type I restriction enzyme, R subunit
MKVTSEEAFEDLIEKHLLKHGGYEKADPDTFDASLGLIPSDLLAYAELAQPKIWAKLQTTLGESLGDKVIKAFVSMAQKQGVLGILRHGLEFHGRKLRFCTFQPAHGLNPQVEELYKANRLAVARQVHFDPKAKGKSLDLVIFLNGIPLVTAEVKNALTNQKATHAIRQYQQDRDPTAPIFRFKERALVHFAIGNDEVHMTTRLAKKSTFFLPFNRGCGTGAGNPTITDKHRTSYLWEEIWKRDSLLDIFARFVHLQKTESKGSDGKKKTKEVMIFPRYHQLDCVRELVKEARTNGAGANYLVQHSTGSGKSNSIAWLAHRLATLHDEDDNKVYDSVVVITDRVILDRQLQDTIYQIDHKQGVVKRVEKHSSELAAALKQGVPIIISTIHKFGFIADQVEGLPDRRYAVLVDEAHSSQSGDMAANMKEILGKGSIAAKFKEEAGDVAAPDQAALRAAIARGPQPNLSYFAFTATPKAKTLELFKHTQDGKPAPFHLYSMRQAIEEKFVLDVLKGYTTYTRYFELIKAIEDDPELDKKKAARALARFVNLHPTNVAQKVEVVVEHFRSTVMQKLGGKAKAMVVTASRLMAVRYKKAFDAYVKEKAYGDLSALVAFSGDLRDPDDPTTQDKPYTEPEMNKNPTTGKPLAETELRRAFAGDEYNVLIVANKYQTGFDQPLLCAMYVDKRLSGIQAVQTLSRLNRCYPGKEETFVLDFVNDRKEILASFQDYYEGTTVAEESDPQRLHELEAELNDTQVYHQSEIDSFASVFFKHQVRQRSTDNARLNAALDPAVDRFKALEEDKAEDFRGKLQAYCNLYGFLAQVFAVNGPGLEKLYAFGKCLLRKLPAKGESAAQVDLGDDVALHFYRLEKIAQGTLALTAEGTQEIQGPGSTGTGQPKPEVKERLSSLIQVINDRFTTEFDAQDLVDAVAAQLLADPKVQEAAEANDKEHFGIALKKPLEDALLDKHGKNGEFVDAVFTDVEILKAFKAEMVEGLFRKLKGERRWGNLTKSLATKGYMHSRLRGRKDAVGWKAASSDPKKLVGLLDLAVQLADSPMPDSFAGTKYPPKDLDGLSNMLTGVLDLAETEAEGSKGLSKAERTSLAGKSARLLEPFWARLLAALEPEAFLERMASFVEKKKVGMIGIGMLHQVLREKGLGPFNEESFKLSPKVTDGWEKLDTFSNSIRDLVDLRLRVAHKSPSITSEEADQAAKWAVIVILSMVEHNEEALRASLGSTSGEAAA